MPPPVPQATLHKRGRQVAAQSAAEATLLTGGVWDATRSEISGGGGAVVCGSLGPLQPGPFPKSLTPLWGRKTSGFLMTYGFHQAFPPDSMFQCFQCFKIFLNPIVFEFVHSVVIFCIFSPFRV